MPKGTRGKEKKTRVHKLRMNRYMGRNPKWTHTRITTSPHTDYAAESPLPCWLLEPRPSAPINLIDDHRKKEVPHTRQSHNKQGKLEPTHNYHTVKYIFIISHPYNNQTGHDSSFDTLRLDSTHPDTYNLVEFSGCLHLWWIPLLDPELLDPELCVKSVTMNQISLTTRLVLNEFQASCYSHHRSQSALSETNWPLRVSGCSPYLESLPSYTDGAPPWTPTNRGHGITSRPLKRSPEGLT